jgi:hypothetical protein
MTPPPPDGSPKHSPLPDLESEDALAYLASLQFQAAWRRSSTNRSRQRRHGFVKPSGAKLEIVSPIL